MRAGIAVVAIENYSKILWTASKSLITFTSMEAERAAIELGIDEIKSRKLVDVVIHTDCESLVQYYQPCREYIVKWVGRANVSFANKLAKEVALLPVRI
jgi:ribonuclease HI